MKFPALLLALWGTAWTLNVVEGVNPAAAWGLVFIIIVGAFMVNPSLSSRLMNLFTGA